MNARTPKVLIVLALTLAACVAPMPAPPVKAPTGQEMKPPVLIPPNQAEQRQNLPVVTDPWAYPDYVNEIWATNMQKVKDAEAARLLTEQQLIVRQLMVGVPVQTRPYIETFAAIKVADAAIAPDSMTTYPDILKGVLEGRMTTTPYLLPEQKATNPKQPDVQAMDDLLKPVTLPEDLTAAKVAMIEHWAVGAPREVQQAIDNYIDDLKRPATSAPAEAPYWQQPWNMPPAPAPAEAPYWQQPWNMPPALTTSAKEPYGQSFFDQWYLEEMSYVQP